jgi:hypothetical protein
VSDFLLEPNVCHICSAVMLSHPMFHGSLQNSEYHAELDRASHALGRRQLVALSPRQIRRYAQSHTRAAF